MARKTSTLPLSRPGTPEDLILYARQFGPESIDALADEMRAAKGAPRIAAANSLLDRGYGKVGQPLEFSGKEGAPLTLVVRWQAEEEASAALPPATV